MGNNNMPELTSRQVIKLADWLYDWSEYYDNDELFDEFCTYAMFVNCHYEEADMRRIYNTLYSLMNQE